MYKVDLTITIGTWNLTLSMKMQFVMINDVTKKKYQHYFSLKELTRFLKYKNAKQANSTESEVQGHSSVAGICVPIIGYEHQIMF